VTNPRVPRLVRHSLNLESGMNDGLALPAVLAFSAALGSGADDFVWYEFVLKDIVIGLAVGVALGYLAAWAPVPDRAKSQYVLGAAFAIYGITIALPDGNGFIAVFVGAITLGIRRGDLAHAFAVQAQDIVEIVKLGVFVVFGAVLTLDALFNDGWAAVAIVVFTLLVARPVAIWAALAGTRLDTATKAFMAWFGPKGVATMAFSIFVLGQGIAQGERIFDIAALAVFASIIAHGLTDTPGSEWIATRSGEPSKRAYAP
jgi:NhaP-type Na+/H+ or K+/H+ antiporter